MSYEKAKEPLSENNGIYLNDRVETKQDRMLHNLGKSLYHLIEAVESDLAEIKRAVGAGPQHQQ